MRKLTVLLVTGIVMLLGAIAHFILVPPIPLYLPHVPNTTSPSFLDETSKRREYLEHYLSKKPFLSVEDGALQLELEQMRSESERGKVAIVTSIVGGYDLGPPLPIDQTLIDDPRIDFFFFCDDSINYTVSPPWRIIQKDYFFTDMEVDLRTKNSISTLKSQPQKLRHLWNMQSKYINHLGWRVPELRPYRYIMYVGGGFELRYLTSPTFYDRVTGWLSNGTLMFLSRHESSLLLEDEVHLSMGQTRYLIDGIQAQMKHYLINYLYDNKPGYIPWLGFMVYDSYSPEIRKLLLSVNGECQIWTLNDQVSFAVFVYRLGLRDRVRLFPGNFPSPFCQTFLQLPEGVPCRTKHATITYGQA